MPKVKYTTVSIQEISAQPTLRLDPGYWIKKKSFKPQATSGKPQARHNYSIYIKIKKQTTIRKEKDEYI